MVLYLKLFGFSLSFYSKYLENLFLTFFYFFVLFFLLCLSPSGFVSVYGATTCSECVAGKWGNANKTLCNQCNAGLYTSEIGAATPRGPCHPRDGESHSMPCDGLPWILPRFTTMIPSSSGAAPAGTIAPTHATTTR